jgi:enoyl-CoA hydratase
MKMTSQVQSEDLESRKIDYELRGPVAHLALNRPGKLNALDLECLDLLEAGIGSAVDDDRVRAVVLSGRGRCFCAGADLGVVAEASQEPALFDDFLKRWHEVSRVIETCAKPTIAAVHGFAMAGGFELTQVCDMVVIGADTTLADQHANFGLFPGGGSTQRLPRMIGKRRAMWMLLSGTAIDAGTALSMGLANEVAPEDRVTDRAQEMALVLSERSVTASVAIKKAVLGGAELSLDDALVLERGLAVGHMSSVDAQTGLAAFRGRTTPDFGFHRESGGS